MNSNDAPDASAASAAAGESVSGILVRSAFDAVVKAWLALLLGGIALSLVGGILGEMLPSRPPGFALSPEASEPSLLGRAWDAAWLTARHYRLALLAAVFFVFIAGARLLDLRGGGGPAPGRPSRTRRALGRLSDEWFGLLVGNAFGAMVSTVVAGWLSFSLERWMIQGALEWIFAGVREFFGGGTGGGGGGALQAWWHWAVANRTAFLFWTFFIGAMLDDLGLPNFKTLGRLAWRGVRRRWNGRATAAPVPGPTAEPR